MIQREPWSGEEFAITSLLDKVFKGWPPMQICCTSLDHWRWKYQGSHFKSNIVVTEEDGTIIGCHHGVTFNVKNSDTTILGTYGTDMAVAPEHRRKGVSRAQVDYLRNLRQRDGVQVALVLASNPYNIESLKKRSPQFPHRLKNLVWIKDVNRFLEHFDIKNKSLIKYGVLGSRVINRVFSGPKDVNTGLSVVDVKRFDERVDDLYDEVSQEYKFITERYMDYLNWRYCDERAGDYRVKIVEDDDRILGYVVFGLNSLIRDHPVGYLMDLHVPKTRPEVAHTLIAESVNWFNSHKVNLINCLLVGGHWHEKILNQHGFFDSRIKFHLFYKPLIQAIDFSELQYYTPDEVMFTWGDHDTLPSKPPEY